jgi:hypothetical protein
MLMLVMALLLPFVATACGEYYQGCIQCSSEQCLKCAAPYVMSYGYCSDRCYWYEYPDENRVCQSMHCGSCCWCGRTDLSYAAIVVLGTCCCLNVALLLALLLSACIPLLLLLSLVHLRPCVCAIDCYPSYNYDYNCNNCTLTRCLQCNAAYYYSEETHRCERTCVSTVVVVAAALRCRVRVRFLAGLCYTSHLCRHIVGYCCCCRWCGCCGYCCWHQTVHKPTVGDVMLVFVQVAWMVSIITQQRPAVISPALDLIRTVSLAMSRRA